MSIESSSVNGKINALQTTKGKNPTTADYQELVKKILDAFKNGQKIDGVFDFSQYYYDEKTAKNLENALTSYASGALSWYNSQDYYCKKGHNATREEYVNDMTKAFSNMIPDLMKTASKKFASTPSYYSPSATASWGYSSGSIYSVGSMSGIGSYGVQSYSVTTLISEFERGNVSVNDFVAQMKVKNINVNKINYGNLVTMAFTYNNKNYQVSCNEKALEFQTDIAQEIYTPTVLTNTYKFTQEQINQYFDVVESINGEAKKYALKQNSGFKTANEVQNELYTEAKNRLVLQNYVINRVNFESDTATKLYTLDNGKRLNKTNYNEYADLIEVAKTPEEMHELRKEALYNFVYDFSQGDLAYAQVSTILEAIGVTNYQHKLQNGNYNLSFEFNGKKYSISCNQEAAKSGVDNIRADVITDEDLEGVNEEFINKHFTKVEGSSPAIYNLNGYNTIDDLIQAYRNDLILDNFLNDVKQEDSENIPLKGKVDLRNGIFYINEQKPKDYTKINGHSISTLKNLSSYYKEIGLAEGEDAVRLREKAVNKFLKDFPSGDVTFTDTKWLLKTMGAEISYINDANDTYEIAFTFNNKQYVTQCTKAAAELGYDRKRQKIYNAQELKDQFGITSNVLRRALCQTVSSERYIENKVLKTNELQYKFYNRSFQSKELLLTALQQDLILNNYLNGALERGESLTSYNGEEMDDIDDFNKYAGQNIAFEFTAGDARLREKVLDKLNKDLAFGKISMDDLPQILKACGYGSENYTIEQKDINSLNPYYFEINFNYNGTMRTMYSFNNDHSINDIHELMTFLSVDELYSMLQNQLGLNDWSEFSYADIINAIYNKYIMEFNKEGFKISKSQVIEDLVELYNMGKNIAQQRKWGHSSSNVRDQLAVISTLNGEIGAFSQGDIGDCWLLSGLDALNANEKGREIIKNNISWDTDYQKVSVYFPGLDKDNKYITITIDEIVNARKNGNKKGYSYSQGDTDALVIELAMEKLTGNIDNGENGIKFWESQSTRSFWQKFVPNVETDWHMASGVDDLIDGLLSIVNLSDGKIDMDKGNVFKYLKRLCNAKQAGQSFAAAFWVFSINSHNWTFTTVDGEYVDYALSLSRDGILDTCGHGLIIKDVTENTVSWANPWNTAKVYTVTWEEFAKMGIGGIEYAFF